MPTIKLDAALRVERPAGDDSAPKWNKLVPHGTFHRGDFPGGKLVVDAAWCTAAVANWEAEGRPERPINYFHRGETFSGDPTPITEKVAAGWISQMEARADGLWGLINWTSKARTLIAADELRFLSPEIVLSGADRRTGKRRAGALITGAALLNDPYFVELPRVAAAAASADSATGGVMPLDKARICAALGLPAEASDDDVYSKLEGSAKAAAEAQAKVAAAAKEAEEAKAKLAALEQDSKVKLSASETETTKLSARVEALEKKNNELVTAQRDAEHKAFFDGLVRDLKLQPGERADYEKLALAAGLESVKFLAKREPFIAAGEVGSGAPGEGAGGASKAEDARLKFAAAVAEHQTKGLSVRDARAAAKAAHPDLYKLAMTVDQVV